MTIPPRPVALITGSGSGIGRAAALNLAREGFRLALVGRQAQPLHETAAAVRVHAGQGTAEADDGPLVLPADVGDAGQIAAAIDAAVDRWSRLDALVNNAGAAPLLPIDQSTPAIIDETFRVNALAPAYAIAHAWPIFVRQRSGCIVNISTMGTDDPFPGFFAYAASKASVNLMARSCAKEGAAHRIRAFAIAPAAVETGMLRGLFSAEVIPPERCMSPKTVGAVIADCILGRRDADNGRTIFLAGEQESQ